MSGPVSLLTDEDVRGPILEGLRLHHPEIDVIDVRDVGLDSSPDPIVLEWAAAHDRVVVTQDEETMISEAYDRIANGLPMPGLILAPLRCPVRLAIADIARLVANSDKEPLDGLVRHLPLDKGWRVSEEEPAWAVAGA